jgi:hypothetical protein
MAVVYATFSTWVTPTVQVEKGQMWDDSDPVVRSHPDWFTSDPAEFVRHSGSYTAATASQVGPEAATANPGEKRSVAKVDETFDEAASLRDDLEKAGVKVDKRWGLDKLREEYAKAAK